MTVKIRTGVYDMSMVKNALTVFITVFFLAGSVSLLADFDDSDGAGRPQMGRGGHGRKGGFESLVMMKEELNLSAAQYEKIKSISEKYAEKRYARRGERDMDAMHELNDAERNEIEAVLNSSQIDKLKVLPAERRAEMMKEHLELSDLQYNRILAISKQYARKAYEMRGQGDRDAMRELREKEREAIEAVLTDEQKEQMKERPQGRGRGMNREE